MIFLRFQLQTVNFFNNIMYHKIFRLHFFFISPPFIIIVHIRLNSTLMMTGVWESLKMKLHSKPEMIQCFTEYVSAMACLPKANPNAEIFHFFQDEKLFVTVIVCCEVRLIISGKTRSITFITCISFRYSANEGVSKSYMRLQKWKNF